MSFTGKYEMTSSEKFDEFLKAIGVGLLTRKVANQSKPTLEITDNGDNIVLKTISALKTTEVTFPLGKEIDEETADGRKCKTTMTRDGNVLTQTQKLEGYETLITRTLTPEGLTAVFKAGDVTCTRVYKKA